MAFGTGALQLEETAASALRLGGAAWEKRQLGPTIQYCYPPKFRPHSLEIVHVS